MKHSSACLAVALTVLLSTVRAFDFNIDASYGCTGYRYNINITSDEYSRGASAVIDTYLRPTDASYYDRYVLEFSEQFYISGVASKFGGQYNIRYDTPLTQSYPSAVVRVAIADANGRTINFTPTGTTDPDQSSFTLPIVCLATFTSATPTPTQVALSIGLKSSSSSSSTTPTLPPTIVPTTPSSNISVGAIAGGVVGGIAALAVLVVAMFYSCVKRRRGRSTEANRLEHGGGNGGASSAYIEQMTYGNKAFAATAAAANASQNDGDSYKSSSFTAAQTEPLPPTIIRQSYTAAPAATKKDVDVRQSATAAINPLLNPEHCTSEATQARLSTIAPKS